MKLVGYRVSANKTQEDCAKVIGKRKETYALKEKGCTPFTIDEASLLSKYLGCPLEEFMSASLKSA